MCCNRALRRGTAQAGSAVFGANRFGCHADPSFQKEYDINISTRNKGGRRENGPGGGDGGSRHNKYSEYFPRRSQKELEKVTGGGLGSSNCTRTES